MSISTTRFLPPAPTQSSGKVQQLEKQQQVLFQTGERLLSEMEELEKRNRWLQERLKKAEEENALLIEMLEPHLEAAFTKALSDMDRQLLNNPKKLRAIITKQARISDGTVNLLDLIKEVRKLFKKEPLNEWIAIEDIETEMVEDERSLQEEYGNSFAIVERPREMQLVPKVVYEQSEVVIEDIGQNPIEKCFKILELLTERYVDNELIQNFPSEVLIACTDPDSMSVTEAFRLFRVGAGKIFRGAKTTGKVTYTVYKEVVPIATLLVGIMNMFLNPLSGVLSPFAQILAQVLVKALKL